VDYEPSIYHRSKLFFDTIKAKLESGGEFKLAGLGVFGLRDKRERPGRNPKTGEDKIITARRVSGEVVTFRCSPALKGLSNRRVTKGQSYIARVKRHYTQFRNKIETGSRFVA